MKKTIPIFLSLLLLLCIFSVFAENLSDTDNTPIDPALAKSQVFVSANIADTPFKRESNATFELLTLDGKSLGTKTMRIESDTKHLIFTFNVPTYAIGTHFTLRAVDGIDSFIYYEDKYHTGTPITLPTYKYIDADGNEVDSTGITITINPLYDKTINLFYNGTSTPTAGARIINGTAMVPASALAEFLGFNVEYNSEYNVQIISLADKYMYFNLDTAYTTILGNDLFASNPTIMIDGVVYISLRTFANAIGSSLEVKDYITHMDINMSESSLIREHFDQLPVNQWGISSRTNYMVWVSLSEYKVRLYEGSQYMWRPILETTCAIGAPSTPTVTGSFEYKYKDRWNYGSYYVGPCLVFYGGYALHSVLLNYNDTEYDGRVGVKISHGCIRLKKHDIDFIANTIPVGTRIYITP